MQSQTQIERYYNGKENPFFDGMLFETYFNEKGQFQYGYLCMDYLENQLKWIGNEKLACSFKFLERALKPFEANLLFVPSCTPQRVVINVTMASGMLQTPWSDTEDVENVVSIKFETKELSDENVAPIYHGITQTMSMKELADLISVNFGIPHSYLMIVTNKPECKKPIHLIHGLVKLQDLAKV